MDSDLIDDAKEAAEVLRILSHPERLIVLCQLREGERNVSQLLENSTLSQSAFSQHLSVLRQANLVTTRKSSQSVYYSLSVPKVKHLIDAIQCAWCERQNKRTLKK
ncbi:transcriptional regulator [Enterovibrio norvegicus]|uniref:ArsR/SmtB family transcription factor n=1 Tax=Enterovibrio norvegicus TaxID=188144 RepID=UPI000C819070|nr:metalloregulator ArsR/SmtB family transcription factor [Enterovibrio norvegicus]MCC4799010.1 metalloregulator ArsR/SmtB family transcription factor [Enterovibrio norvegicus]PMI29352.1 transcriptional regulator [Enterovibrio norvegicus]PMI37869.1 transcriptional regulator [Enterovibrio norvegicus]PMN46458.1 transcriptional regulator [Enterovibrio norvegicus]TKF10948.1 helix-turn-helix transcriptional regulator [Enterovibrio norvegicus]